MPARVQNAIAAQKKAADNSPLKSMQTLVKSMQGEISKALPSVLTPERFSRMVLTTLSSNKDLAMCEPKSFLGAMMQAAQLGLEPNSPLQQAYLIPYKDHGVLKAQFQLGYKGLIDLAYRSGEIESIQAHIVYENDEFICEYGLEPKLRHVPADYERGEPVKVYAMFKTKSGGYGFEVLSVAECREHAKKFSQSASSSYSPWTTNFEEMCKKTVLKKVLKYAPLKTDFVRGISSDETIKSKIDEDMYSVENEADYNNIVTVDENGEVLNNDRQGNTEK